MSPNAVRHRRCDSACPRNTSSTMTRAPARTIATIPVSHAASRVLNSAPTTTSPSGPNSIPASDSRMAAGSASTNVSVPKVSHGSGNTACRHRAIADFPELDPPLSMIT